MIEPIRNIINLLNEADSEASVAAYRNQFEEFDHEAKVWLSGWFGLCLLSGNTALLECEFPDTAITIDYKFARQALDAYCQNQQAQVVQLILRKLSYDSPYKDFRLVISTLLDVDDAPARANKLRAIGKSSPYHQIAELVRLAVEPSDEPTDLAELNPESRQFITALRSKFSTSHQQLLAENLTFQQRFELLLDNSSVIDPANLKLMLLNLLVDYPVGLDVYQTRFGTLADFELLRLQALASERSGDWDKAVSLWNDCLQTVNPQVIEQSEAVGQLISQRVSQCQEHGGYDSPEQQVLALKQQLQQNPDDHKTCLKLLAHYQTTGDEQAYKELLKQGILQFPQQPEIVASAVENASETVEFEDATLLARTLLDNDALNQDVRRLLIQAYLSYADKLALRGQRYATQTILDQAEALERPKPSGVVSLHRALMHYVVGEETKAEQAVELGCTQLDSYLIGYTQMVAETARLGFKKKYTKHYLKLIRSLVGYQPNAEEIVALIQLLHGYISDPNIDGNELLSVLRPFIQGSLEADYSNTQLRFICKTLEQINAYEDLHQVALSASRRNQQADAEFEYYRILGLTRGDPAQINREDSQILEQLLDRLAEEDPKLRVRITEFLNANVLPGSATLELNADHRSIPTTQHNTDISLDGIVTTFKRLFKQ